MQEVTLVLEQNAHPLACTEQNLMSIIIDMRLQIQNLGGGKELACCICQLLGVLLCDSPRLILVELFDGEKQGPYMIKVLELQASEEIRKLFKSYVRLPAFPSPHIIEPNRRFLDHVQSQLLHGIEDGPLLGGWPWAYPCDGADLLSVGGLVNADRKSHALVPFVTTCGRGGNRANVALV